MRGEFGPHSVFLEIMSDEPEEEAKLNLDPEVDKQAIEDRIIKHIEELLPNASHEEVVEAVETEYEELLAHAKVKLHIPTLVENLALKDVREHRPPGHRFDDE